MAYRSDIQQTSSFHDVSVHPLDDSTTTIIRTDAPSTNQPQQLTTYNQIDSKLPSNQQTKNQPFAATNQRRKTIMSHLKQNIEFANIYNNAV